MIHILQFSTCLHYVLQLFGGFLYKSTSCIPSKRLWKILNKLLSTKSKSTHITELAAESDPSKVCEIDNIYIIEVASELSEQITGEVVADPVIVHEGELFNFSFCELDDVVKAIEHISSCKLTGMKGIYPRLLHDACDIIAPYLQYMINCSLQSGVIPASWKQSQVTPVYKDEDRTNPAHYRPISITPFISKMIERVVYDQVYAYLQTHECLYEHQSRFRSGFSTETALLHLVDSVLNELDRGNLTGILFLDFRKAVDTVNHARPLEKLNWYSIRGVSLIWFKNFLYERMQITTINGSESPGRLVECGVPQGSILGPFLYILYMNDMKYVINHCNMSLFADDTSLYVSNSSANLIFPHYK